MYVCLCQGVTEKQIRREVVNGAESYEDIQERLNVGMCCGTCKEYAVNLVNDTLQEQLGKQSNVINLWPQAV